MTAPAEGPARTAQNFEWHARDRRLQELFESLNAAGQAEVMERAQRTARHRGIMDVMIGFGLAVLRARNEIVDMEIGLDALPVHAELTLAEQSKSAAESKLLSREKNVMDRLRKQGFAEQEAHWQEGRE